MIQTKSRWNLVYYFNLFVEIQNLPVPQPSLTISGESGISGLSSWNTLFGFAIFGVLNLSIINNVIIPYTLCYYHSKHTTPKKIWTTTANSNMENQLSQTQSVNDNCLCLQIICVNVVSVLRGRVWMNRAASGQMAPGSRPCGSVIHTNAILMGLYRSPFVGWSSDFFSPRIPCV